jgi:hypothetical protein
MGGSVFVQGWSYIAKAMDGRERVPVGIIVNNNYKAVEYRTATSHQRHTVLTVIHRVDAQLYDENNRRVRSSWNILSSS